MKDRALAERLGAAMRSRRQRLEVSQEAFADQIGMHRTYYSALERGEIKAAVGGPQEREAMAQGHGLVAHVRNLPGLERPLRHRDDRDRIRELAEEPHDIRLPCRERRVPGALLKPIRSHAITSQSTGVLLSRIDREPAPGCEAAERRSRGASSVIRGLNVSRMSGTMNGKLYIDYINLCRVATARLVGSGA